MHAEILNTGSELLLGQVLNTHLSFLAQSLFPVGVLVSRQTTVPDGPDIRTALLESFQRSQIVIVTGGLGPTTDDVTREITADLLGMKMLHDPAVEAAIADRFKKRGIPMTSRVLRQAQKPEGAQILPNPFGTAPGLYLPPHPLPDSPLKSPHLFLLPGPPRELQPMVETSVLPILKSVLPSEAGVLMRTWRIVGVPESIVEDKVGEALIALGIDPGYCARLGEVDVRVLGTEQQISSAGALLEREFHNELLPSDSRTIEEWLLDQCTQKAWTIATAESCTGGSIANRITNVPGSSAVFLTGEVTYANEAKERLGVPNDLIVRHGAVSEEVAGAMAAAVRTKAGSTFGLATTGIAGPGGATDTKPLGTVFIACAGPDGKIVVEKQQFQTDRLSFKNLATQAALNLLRKEMATHR